MSPSLVISIITAHLAKNITEGGIPPNITGIMIGKYILTFLSFGFSKFFISLTLKKITARVKTTQ
jgi:hypothetical protein